jgi:hypothetical protein
MPKRTQAQISNDREILKKLILEKFSDVGFTTGEIFYTQNKTWNKSKFGSLFHDLIQLTKQKFLSYEIRKRKTVNGKFQTGAVYKLIK